MSSDDSNSCGSRGADLEVSSEGSSEDCKDSFDTVSDGNFRALCKFNKHIVGSWLAHGRPDSTRLQIGVVVVASRHELNKLTFFVMVSTKYEPSSAGLTTTTTIVCLLNKQDCKETQTSMREMLTL